ncbi:hypothetical protein WR25_15306 [Diploscapter pachys]|uniref:Uncharacterized protein n=1 Tax=Diploscapter pachys TaxID=2018661 RepID=A0A2A2K9S4_9BILA|nr:hypothetical protein WR25_15306 [Diploscapter pachys]
MLLDQRNELNVRMLATHHVDAKVGLSPQYGFQPIVGTQVQQADADFRADPAGSAFEQRCTEPLLEFLDPSAQGGLGQVQCFCSLVKTAKFGDFYERSNILQFIFHQVSLSRSLDY